MDSSLTVIDLFSGIGGIRLGFEETMPINVVASVELDPLARFIYRKRFKHFGEQETEFGDIRKFYPTHFSPRRPSAVIGGFPCTDTSSAGKRQGLSGPESGLWAEMLRVVESTRPTFVVVENPEGLRHRGLFNILNDLHESGYISEWQTIGAARAFGAPHARERIFVVAYSHALCHRFQVGEESWEEQLRGGVNEPGPYTDHKDYSLFTASEAPVGRGEGNDAVPPWLGGISPQRWAARWQPPADAGRPKNSDTPMFASDLAINNAAINLYALSCVPAQAAIAARRVRYLTELAGWKF
ncbi:MAG TPA: DNA (cytosine-5-)-methyltransferase [Vampirovibrionales bacterium]